MSSLINLEREFFKVAKELETKEEMEEIVERLEERIREKGYYLTK